MIGRKRTVRGTLSVGAGVLLGALLAGGIADAQVTDANGYITSNNWLALGPFTNDFGCSGSSQDILCDHIAPSILYCQWPQDGDEVEYDPALACTNAYIGPTGPTGKPTWRPFSDGSDDCDNDLDADAGGDRSDVVTFLVTYVEWFGEDPVAVQICANSDDGLQVWWDDEVVINNNACRPRGSCAAGACDDVGVVTATPGFHRILMGAWERAGGWGNSLRLRIDGVPVRDGEGDMAFYGTDRAGDPPACGPLARRDVAIGRDPVACPPDVGGPVDVKVSQESAAATSTVVEIVEGPITEDDVTGTPAPSSKEPIYSGFIQRWLLLGPYENSGGADPNTSPDPPQIEDDFLTDGTTTEAEIAPQAGDTIESLAPLAVTPNDGIINPDGIPTWSLWEDADDTIDFNGYYGGDVDYIMMYAVTYVDLTRATDVSICAGSDDSIQILLDGVSVWVNNIPRGWGAAGQCQDIVPLGNLSAGLHKIMVKVFEGGGAHGFRLRLFDSSSGMPLGTGDIRVCVDPEKTDCTADFPKNGAKLTWTDVPKATLESGIQYKVDVLAATLRITGTVNGRKTVADGTFTFAPAADLGPFSDFTHGHDIGNEGCTGTGIVEDPPGVYTITGAGSDIWNNADQFTYAYREISGNFRAQIHIVDRILGASEWAKHGIMARENCSPGSRYSIVCDQNNAGLTMGVGNCFQWRPAQDAGAAWPGSSPLGGVHHDYVRLERLGSVFTGYSSATGEAPWIRLGSFDWGADAPDTVQVGLAVTSHDGCNLVTVTFDEWSIDSGPIPSAPTNLACAFRGVRLGLTWDLPGAPAGEQRISVNGVQVGTVAADAKSGFVSAADLSANADDDGVGRVCVENDVGSACCGYSLMDAEELYVNCGGARLDDALGTGVGDGRIWLEDSLANPSPFLASNNANTANFGFVADTQLVEPDFVDNPAGVSVLFATERWEDGDVIYRFAVPEGDYQVTLLFAEGCCSEGCQDIPDPALSAGGCRVFDIRVNGQLVEDQFSQHVEVSRALGNALPNAIWGIALAKGPYAVTNAGSIEVMIDDLGGGNPPENASIKGIAIVKGGAPPVPKFRRGDANADSGVPNITDGIFILNFLFLGGPAPPCDDAADTNDDGSHNITDGIYLLNYLFLGGPAPPAPGPDDCGVDPTGDALGCASFPPCP